MADPIYVASSGHDGNPGSADKPLASLQKAVDKAVANQEIPQEIVMRPGVYHGGIIVDQPTNNQSKVLPLVIRAERKKDGTYEDVILDGGQLTGTVTAVADKEGVFKAAFKRNPKFPYEMWEEDTRIRYHVAASAASVDKMPGTYHLTDSELFFHTSDGRPPGAHRVGLASESHGIIVKRAGVMICGIQFKNFLLQRFSSGVLILSDGAVSVEDCRVWNSKKGFFIGEKGRNVKILRCRADDVATGVFSYGINTIVEDCQFFRVAGPFEIQDYSQDQSGVQCYHPAHGGEVRRTLCVGFTRGLFFKCPSSRFVAENNTLVGGENSLLGMGCTEWSPDSIFRYNIVVEFKRALLDGAKENGIPQGADINYNCLWQPDGGGQALKQLVEKKNGSCNVNGDPLFSNPKENDYRVRRDSPVATLGTDGKPIGALGVADNRPVRLLTPMPEAVAGKSKDVERSGALPACIAPAFVKRMGPIKNWHVDPDRGRDAATDGAEDKPVKSLQFALNHANPGDRVVLQPGIYFGAYTLNHGGTKQAPIIVESSPKGRAVLDGMKQFNEACLTLANAPDVIIRGLEIRWFKQTGVLVEASPNVRIENCMFWNDLWSGPRIGIIGTGVHANKSPGLSVDHCLFYAMYEAFAFLGSPSFRVTYTTATKLTTRVLITDSVANSMLRNNSFTFTGNSHAKIITSEEEMRTFSSDYNNFAMFIRKGAPRRPAPEDDLKPAEDDFFRQQEAKSIMVVVKPVSTNNAEGYYSLREWQEKTGLDKHSIYKHPCYADPLNRDFRLKPDSPNIGAGENGTTIGALGVVEKVQ